MRLERAMPKSRSALLALFVCFACVLTLAQSQMGTGSISGTVTDPNGAVIGDATITVTSVETGMVRKVTTTGTGAFNVPVLPPGTYNVNIEKAGFSSLLHKGVEVNVGGTATLVLQMKVGAVQSVVDV